MSDKPARAIKKKKSQEPSFAIYIGKLHKQVHENESNDLTLSSGTVGALDAMAEYTIDLLARNSKFAMGYAGGKTLSTRVLAGAAGLMLSGKLRDEAPEYAKTAVEKLHASVEAKEQRKRAKRAGA